MICSSSYAILSAAVCQGVYAFWLARMVRHALKAALRWRKEIALRLRVATAFCAGVCFIVSSFGLKRLYYSLFEERCSFKWVWVFSRLPSDTQPPQPFDIRMVVADNYFFVAEWKFYGRHKLSRDNLFLGYPWSDT